MLPRPALLAFALTLSLPALASAQSSRTSGRAPAPRFADPDRLAKLSSAFPVIDSLMSAFAARAKVPGIAYGIIVDGNVVHIGTAGLRSVDANASVDTNTVFRIASMTKSFTALSILELRDEGKLLLDDPAERYVPELTGLKYPTTDSPKITIRLLLSHSTGFPEDNPWGDQQLADTDEQLSRMLARGIPFSTSPGTSYEYSNLGFAILGRVVANVSGMPYARYVRERILLPLGMISTTLQTAQVPASRLAHGYRLQDGKWLEEQQLPDGAFGSMGGMLTSVSDLGKWVGFMLDAWPPRDGAERGPVKRSSAREMQQVARFSGATAVRDATTSSTTLNAGGYGSGWASAGPVSFRCSSRTAAACQDSVPSCAGSPTTASASSRSAISPTLDGADPPPRRSTRWPLRVHSCLASRSRRPRCSSVVTRCPDSSPISTTRSPTASPR